MSWLITGSQKVNWTPADISTALWLDAADAGTITADGSNLISNVNDKSGNGKNLTSSGSNRPTYTVAGQNNKNIITFNGEHRLTASTASDWGFLHSAASSVFVVCKMGASSNPDAAYALYATRLGGGGSGVYFLYDDRLSSPANNQIIVAMRGESFTTFVDFSTADNYFTPNTASQLSLLSDMSQPVAANRALLRLNGTNLVAPNTQTTTAVSSTPTFALTLGGVNATFPLVGFIAEFVVTSSVASTEIRQKMEGYLAHKWGLTASLPSDHPFKTAIPVP